MRTLVIGDIHGGLKALKQLLGRAVITENDRLIFVGDYVDGWSESAEVIRFLIRLSKTNDCVFVKGNHDVWCENWLRHGKAEKVWLEHGGKSAVESYSRFSIDEKKDHLSFFEQLKPYYLDGENRLFIHAGFTSIHGVEHESYESTFYFDRTLWEMAMAVAKKTDGNSKLYPRLLTHYKEIYIGHTPTINFNSEDPMNALNVWNVDTGAAFYGKLSALDIDSKEIFQSEALMALYPNEEGRNERSLNQVLGK